MIELTDVSKSFTLHNQGSAVIPVMEGASLKVDAGECVALTGASGAGKSKAITAVGTGSVPAATVAAISGAASRSTMTCAPGSKSATGCRPR